MENLIGLIVFIVIAIFGVAARYKEAQRAKNDLAPPPPPPKPRQQLPEKTLRQFERREIKMARPAPAPREARPRLAPSAQRPAQPRPAPQAEVSAQPRPAPAQRPAPSKPPQPVFVEEERPRLRPQQVRAQQKPLMREQMQVTPTQMRAGRQAAREALQQAVEQESDTGFETAAAAHQRRAMALPPLFRNMEGIRAGIIFSEIIGPPLSFR